MKRNLFFNLLLVSLGVLLFSCEPQKNEEVQVLSVSLDKPTIEMVVGQVATLVAEVAPEEAADKTLSWTSSDSAIASVSDEGVVTALAAGEVVIEAISNQNSDIKDVCIVSVKPVESGSPYAVVGESEYASITITTEMNGYEGNYYIAVYPKDMYEEDFEKPEQIAQYFLELNDYLIAQGFGGFDATRADGRYIYNKNATIELGDIWSMRHNTDYIGVVCGLDANGKIATVGTTFEGTTVGLPEGSIEVEIDHTTQSDIVINTTPTPEVKTYAVFAHPTEDYIDQLESNPDNVAMFLLADLKANDVDLTQPDGAHVYRGECKEISLALGYPIYWDTDYTVFAFGIDSKGRQCTEVTVVETSTPDYADPAGELASITVSDVTIDDARVVIDAGDYDANYFAAPYAKEDLQEKFDGDADALVADLLAKAKEDYRDFTFVDGETIFAGNADYKIKHTDWALRPGVEYNVYAVGITHLGDVASKVLVSEKFTTEDMPEFTITATVSGIEENFAYVNFKPSVEGIEYFHDVIAKDKIEGKTDEEIIGAYEEEWGKNIILYLSNYEINCAASSLEKDTEYVAISCGYINGSGATTEVFKEEFRTLGGE